MAMTFEPLAISGAWQVRGESFTDDRGSFTEWFRPDQLQAATGFDFVAVQANQSISRRGVVRGMHSATVPPGQAKWVRCTAGSVVDVVLDIRTGSPTFGQHVPVRLDDATVGVVIAPGLAHGFCATSEAATVSYLLSSVYDPATEFAINPLDPALGIEWPVTASEMTLSTRDRAAPTLAEVQAAGVLPKWSAG